MKPEMLIMVQSSCPKSFFTISHPKSQPWGPNNWRIRYTLNYKGTEWIEYPDIASKCQSLGIPPGETDHVGNPQYCVPAIWPDRNLPLVRDRQIPRQRIPDPVMFDGIEAWDDKISHPSAP